MQVQVGSQSLVTSEAIAKNAKMDIMVPVAILAALLVISLLLLVMVIAGWVCTYWAMKKKKREEELKSRDQKNNAVYASTCYR